MEPSGGTRRAVAPERPAERSICVHPERARHRHRAREARHGRDAQGRRHHGRRHPGAGEDRRGRRCRRRHGARAGARRHPGPGRRVPHERPGHDRGHHRGRLDPGHGQGPHRPLRRGAGAAEPRRRLRRRVRGAHPGRLRQPHRQVGVHRALRVRRHQPRRGAAPDRRGRGDDPVEGRGGHRRRLQRDDAHAHDPGGDPPAHHAARRRALRRGQGAAGALRPRRRGRPRRAGCRSSCSPPGASPRPPTPR